MIAVRLVPQPRSAAVRQAGLLPVLRPAIARWLGVGCLWWAVSNPWLAASVIGPAPGPRAEAAGQLALPGRPDHWTDSEPGGAPLSDGLLVVVSGLSPSDRPGSELTVSGSAESRAPLPGALDELLTAATAVATSTATPRLQLPSATPSRTALAPGPTVTARGAASDAAATAPPASGAVSSGPPGGRSAQKTVVALGSPTQGLELGTAGSWPSVGDQPGGAGGPQGDLARDADVTPPALSGPSGELLTGRKHEALSEPRQASAGRRGLIALPTDEPGILRMWREYGSPWQGTTPADRLTGSRPWPWDTLAGYGLLAVLFVLAAAEVWRGLPSAAAGDERWPKAGPERRRGTGVAAGAAPNRRSGR